MRVLNVDSVRPKLQLVVEGDSAKIVLKHLGHTCISRDLVQLLMPFETGYMVAWNARPTTYLLLLVAKITAFVSL